MFCIFLLYKTTKILSPHSLILYLDDWNLLISAHFGPRNLQPKSSTLFAAQVMWFLTSHFSTGSQGTPVPKTICLTWPSKSSTDMVDPVPSLSSISSSHHHVMCWPTPLPSPSEDLLFPSRTTPFLHSCTLCLELTPSPHPNMHGTPLSFSDPTWRWTVALKWFGCTFFTSYPCLLAFLLLWTGVPLANLAQRLGLCHILWKAPCATMLLYKY